MTIQTRSTSIGTFARAGLLGGTVAAVLNVILYFIGNAINGAAMMVDPPGAPPLLALPFPAVIIASILPGLIAGLLYFVLKRFTGYAKTIFLVIAAIIFVAFIFSPISAAQTTTTMWTLQFMHLATALPIIGMLLRADR